MCEPNVNLHSPIISKTTNLWRTTSQLGNIQMRLLRLARVISRSAKYDFRKRIKHVYHDTDGQLNSPINYPTRMLICTQ